MKIDIAQLEFIHPTLRTILFYVEKSTGVEFTITSLFRIRDKGVHGVLPLRGTDLRMRNKEIGDSVTKIINDRWIYNPDAPHKLCAICHGSGSSYHLHIQVHPNTSAR